MKIRWSLAPLAASLLIVGAGCNSAAPANNAAPESPAATSDSSASTDTAVATDPKAPPVELINLGLNKEGSALRFRFKIQSPKEVKAVQLEYTCVSDNSTETGTWNRQWANPDANGQPQPIVSGKTYDSEISFFGTASSCEEVKLMYVNFVDGAEWLNAKYYEEKNK